MLRRLLVPLAPPLCFECGAACALREPLCARCRAALPWLGAGAATIAGMPVWAPLAYEGAARRLVTALKFGRVAGLAEPMAAQIVANAPPGWLADGALVPVPLHPARLHRRGFNQAERIARQVASRTGLEVADCLERSGPGGTQSGRPRAARVSALRGLIRLHRDARLPARALLVDDVVTTGATLVECSAVLERAGSLPLRAVAYARTPGR